MWQHWRECVLCVYVYAVSVCVCVCVVEDPLDGGKQEYERLLIQQKSLARRHGFPLALPIERLSHGHKPQAS